MSCQLIIHLLVHCTKCKEHCLRKSVYTNGGMGIPISCSLSYFYPRKLPPYFFNKTPLLLSFEISGPKPLAAVCLQDTQVFDKCLIKFLSVCRCVCACACVCARAFAILKFEAVRDENIKIAGTILML